jgi:tetratricopeptide (TPR) repeat protein
MEVSSMNVRRAFLPLLAPFAFACATATPPTETLGAAERSIAEATQNDAEPYARLEMHLAREHEAQAQAAMAAERYDEARELAEKALVEAELAEAKANSMRAQQNVTEIREHIATLQREIDRASETGR